MNKPESKFIVAEVSKNWPEQHQILTDSDHKIPRLLSERFEQIINVNLERGYKLHSWRLNRLQHVDEINETIVAVFEKVSQ